MARPKYLKPSNVAYRGNLSRVRSALDKLFDWLLQSPQAKADVEQTFKTFATAAGLNVDAATPSTQVRVNSGVKVLGPAITGSYVNGYTFTIVGGVITAIVAS